MGGVRVAGYYDGLLFPLSERNPLHAWGIEGGSRMCGWSLLGCSVSMRQGKGGILNYMLYCSWEGIHGLALPPSACPMNRTDPGSCSVAGDPQK